MKAQIGVIGQLVKEGDIDKAVLVVPERILTPTRRERPGRERVKHGWLRICGGAANRAKIEEILPV